MTATRVVAIVGGRQCGKTLAMQLLAEEQRRRGDIVVMDETIAEPKPELDPSIPLRLSIDPNSPDFHPCYVRVGVRVDGVERNDLQFYDVKQLSYMTTAKTSHLAESIEPYWRYMPSRQQRRAEERWRNRK